MRTRFALACPLALAVAIGACGDSPTAPPPPVINTPPTIQSVTASGARAEADTVLTFTATVQDAESPASQLTYQWTAAPLPGTFTGSGATVTWRAPHSQTSPDIGTITLTVVESYISAGVAKQNVVSSSVKVHYNDSVVELTNLGTDFLVNKFGNYNVSPQECVSNFSDSCRGKADELSDITLNRQNFEILSATFSVSSITFNNDKTFATVVGPCVFIDIIKATGVRERVSAICTLTAVYENFKWFLCESRAGPGPGGTTPVNLLRGRVPGRID